MSNINGLPTLTAAISIKTETASGTERNYGIDFLKFVFANAILYYHLMIFLVQQFPENALFMKLRQRSSAGGTAVAFFFIIAGYFLAKSFNKETVRSLVMKKIIRLYPLLLFSDVIMLKDIIMLKKEAIDGFIANLFFLDSSLGVTRIPAPNAPLWFVCVLFWLSLFFICWINLLTIKKNFSFSVFFLFYPGICVKMVLTETMTFLCCIFSRQDF